MRRTTLAALPYVIFSVIFTVIPLLLMVYFSMRVEIPLDVDNRVTLTKEAVVATADGKAMALPAGTELILTKALEGELTDGTALKLETGLKITSADGQQLSLIKNNGVNYGIKFSFDNFVKFFSPQQTSSIDFIKVFLDSLYVAFIATAICLLLGYPLAYILAGMRPFARGMLYFLLMLPMWMNFLIRTYAWRPILADNGMIHSILKLVGVQELPQLMPSEGAVVLGLVYNLLPFMVMPIFNMLTKFDKSLLEAANDLGATPIYTFRKVVFPLTLPGVVSGVMMTFLPAMTTFSVSKILGGGKTFLIGDLIERQFKTDGNWGFGAAVSMILMVIMLLSMKALMRAQDESEGGLM
ncbi:MAG: ABC transporter permease [Clostridia bacterium]|nr:ABC transporter permease [Clostridia bacterium]